jgi:hypothetical protein
VMAIKKVDAKGRRYRGQVAGGERQALLGRGGSSGRDHEGCRSLRRRGLTVA